MTFIVKINKQLTYFICTMLFIHIISNSPNYPNAKILSSMLKMSLRDPGVAQRFSACLWPRARSWRLGIESHVGLPAWSLLLPLPVSPPLSFSLCVSYEYINLKKNKDYPYLCENFIVIQITYKFRP